MSVIVPCLLPVVNYSFPSLSKKSAYTLLEVLIALGLMSAVMMFVLLAIDIHLRQLVVNRTEVEEAQLARAVLESIAKDIRSVVVQLRQEELEVDTSALSAVFGLSAAGLDTDVLSELQTAIGTTQTAETEEGTTEDAAIYGTMPGIYGDLDWIQIDTARLPRGETFGSKQTVNGSLFVDRLSPSKTVLYYLGEDTGQIQDAGDPRYQPDQLTGSLGRSLDQNAVRYGLFRRQLDRMVTQYAVNESKETEYEQYDEPFAPEVEWIEFAYYEPGSSNTVANTSSGGTSGSGTAGGTASETSSSTNEQGQWLDYWDMDDMQKLPAAVRITVAIRRQHIAEALGPWSTADAVQTITYSLVVPIPVNVEPAQEEADSGQ